MEYGICLLPVIPLRREPNDRSEMLTQVLFGETLRIFEKKQQWLSVETDLDSYPGWLAAGQVVMLEESTYHAINNATVYLTTGLLSRIREEGQEALQLPAGCALPGLEGNTMKVGERVFHYEGKARLDSRGTVEELVESALAFRNVPYLWGGRTVLGVDCSGFTQCIYRLNGVSLPRDASQQAGVGQQVSFLSEASPGDLAFFDNAEGTIVHVGLLLEDQKVIHASGKVRVDILDHHGIFNADSRNYSHQLRLIRRILE